MIIEINNEKITNISLLKLKTDNPFIINDSSIWFNKKNQSQEISIDDLKINIENSSILNYSYDFLSLDGNKNIIPSIIKINLVDNVNIPTSEDIFEHYYRNTGEITITEKLLLNEQFLPTSFPEHLYASVGQSKLLIFAIVHEIGHAIHHQLFLKQDNNLLIPSYNDFNNNDFFNLISNNGLYLLGKTEENKKYDINHSIKYAIKEGFADLYACIGLTKIYPKDVALNFISEVIDARKTGNDNYYTIDSLNQLKIDIEADAINLNNFNDLHYYIDQTISHTALKTMLEKFNSTSEKQINHNNAFAGFLTSLMNKCYEQNLFDSNPLENVFSLNETVNILDLHNNELGIKLENLKEDQDSFNKGYNATNDTINDVKETNFLSSKLHKKLLNNKVISIRNKSYKNVIENSLIYK